MFTPLSYVNTYVYVSCAVLTLGMVTNLVSPEEIDALLILVQNASTALASLSIEPAQLCSGGCPDALSAAIADGLAIITDKLNASLVCLEATLVDLLDILDTPQRLQNGAPAVFEAIADTKEVFYCGWLRSEYVDMFKPLLGDLLGGIQGLSISMLFVGLGGVVLLGALIWLQVQYGGVGKQPGCPRLCLRLLPCRCCCPASRVESPCVRCVSGEVEVIDATVVDV